MADRFLNLSDAERQEALGVAASNSGRPAHLLEKDVWVVWCLGALFGSPLGEHLVFKGGTSLSKVYGAIRRFSEDVDLTYDIRAIAPDLVKSSDSNPVPQTRSRGKVATTSSAGMARADLAQLISDLNEQMLAAARELQFELAARIRDEISELKKELRGMDIAGVR